MYAHVEFHVHGDHCPVSVSSLPSFEELLTVSSFVVLLPVVPHTLTPASQVKHQALANTIYFIVVLLCLDDYEEVQKFEPLFEANAAVVCKCRKMRVVSSCSMKL
jgi:hypothetical protein